MKGIELISQIDSRASVYAVIRLPDLFNMLILQYVMNYLLEFQFTFGNVPHVSRIEIV